MMETIRSWDGTEIAYRRSGAGRPLLLVHGGTADHTRWRPVLPPLEREFTVCAMDRRGRGGSGDEAPYAVEREFEDVAALVDAIGEPVALLGHSFGAVCALEGALLTPNVRRLILYEPPPPGVEAIMPSDVAARLAALLAAGDRDGVVATFLREVAELPPHEVAMMRSLPAWAGRAAAAHTILREMEGLKQRPPFDGARYARLRMPALLLLGGDSPSLYQDSIAAVAGALGNSRVAVMPGQQHVAMNTAPELFVKLVLEFLAEGSGQ
jgi:pimeloyl-ACP methyl ester carboxylesterase